MKLPFLLGEKRYIFETMILDRDFLILIKTVVAISRMSGILSFEKNFFKNETSDNRLMKLSDEQCGRIVIFLFQRNDNGLFYSHYFTSNHYIIQIVYDYRFSSQVVILLKNGTFIVPSFTRSAHFQTLDSSFSNFFILPITHVRK